MALHGVFAPRVADQGLIQGAAPRSNSATMRADTSAYRSRFIDCLAAMADATKIGRVPCRVGQALSLRQADGRNSIPGGAWTGAPSRAPKEGWSGNIPGSKRSVNKILRFDGRAVALVHSERRVHKKAAQLERLRFVCAGLLDRPSGRQHWRPSAQSQDRKTAGLSGRLEQLGRIALDGLD